MNTQEILSIVALSLLGLCLLCGLAKMAMRGDSAKKNCDKACSMAVFATVVLLAISQLIGETDGYAVASEVLTASGCQIMPKNECDDTAPCCHTRDGACVKQGTGKWKPPGGAGCCRVGENCLPEQPVCCPTVAECGTITGCSGLDGCPPAGTNFNNWWKNNCAAPTPSPSQ